MNGATHDAWLRFSLTALFNGDGQGRSKPGPDVDQYTPEPASGEEPRTGQRALKYQGSFPVVPRL